MVEISLKSRSDPSDWRCPWCHEGETGEAWQVCENDATPIHAACLHEYGLCPICRESVRGQAMSATEAAQSLTIRVRPRAASATFEEWTALRIPELSEETQHLLAAIHGNYSSSSWPLAGCLLFLWLASFALKFLTLPVLLGLSTALLGSILFRLRSGRGAPRVEVWLMARVTEARRSLAESIVAGDQQALETAARFHEQQRALQSLNERLSALRDDLQRDLRERRRDRIEARREQLRAESPIEDAQRIRGVGPGITTRLRAAGIDSLASLRAYGQRPVTGIGPARRALLAEWARLREAAIERLAESQIQAPSLVIRPEQNDEIQRIRQLGAELEAELLPLEAHLRAWQSERESLIARLQNAD